MFGGLSKKSKNAGILDFVTRSNIATNTSKKSENAGILDPSMRMHGTVTVGTKGQIVIPKEVRDMLDINEGENLLAITKYGTFVGFIKTDDVAKFIELLRKEANLSGK